MYLYSRHWGNWQDGYRIMKYTGGAGCWNGPARSTLVSFSVLLLLLFLLLDICCPSSLRSTVVIAAVGTDHIGLSFSYDK